MSDNKGYRTPKKFDTPLSHFKTPKSNQTSNLTKQESEYFTPIGRDMREMSDSEESTKSSAASENGASSGTGSCNSEDLSIVAEFDELMRLMRQQRCDEVEDKFLDFVEQVKEMNTHWRMAREECQRLQIELDKRTHDYRDMECKLGLARKLLDQERKRARKIEEERDSLEVKMARAADILFNNHRNRLPDETRQQLAFLNNTNQTEDYNGHGHGVPPQLSAIQEVNTTGSLLSDFSYSRSEDDLDTSALQSGKTWKKHRPSIELAGEPALKKRRSGSKSKVVEINTADTVRATTTLTVAKDGPITATSIIESVPPEPSAPPRSPIRKVFSELHPSAPPEQLVFDLWQRDSPRTGGGRPNHKQHSFQTKTVVMPETCGPCDKRIRFGKTAYKCKDCRAVCHPECKDSLPMPCVPLVNTPTQRGMLGVIADYTPASAPMVPALIIHCVNEIEIRGLNELGIYRVPGSERDVKSLKEKFLRGKGAPILNQTDIHVVCGTVKDFLRSLHEPLITHSRWWDFVRAVEAKDEMDVAPALYQIISELPQPNRDTLAYMMCHLKRVGVSPECKMPAKNLAKVFGPTIVGYSSSDPNPTSLLTETRQQCMVMEKLIELPADYWGSFVNCNDNGKTSTNKLQQTPSTDSLLCATATRGIFTPHGSRSTTKRKQRFFPTPPSYK